MAKKSKAPIAIHRHPKVATATERPSGIIGPDGQEGQVLDSTVFFAALGQKDMELFMARKEIGALRQQLGLLGKRIAELEGLGKAPDAAPGKDAEA